MNLSGNDKNKITGKKYQPVMSITGLNDQGHKYWFKPIIQEFKSHVFVSPKSKIEERLCFISMGNIHGSNIYSGSDGTESTLLVAKTKFWA